MTGQSFVPYDAASLPPVVVRYLVAQGDGSGWRAVAAAFAPDARVTDEGISYEGEDGIRAWLTRPRSDYRYTTTLLGQRDDESGRWVVRARLEGDFPGGVAELRFRFAVRGDEIAELVIAP